MCLCADLGTVFWQTRPCVFTGQLSFQGTLNTFPWNSLPPLQDERGALCLFPGYEHLVLRAVVAPTYQVHLGLCIPEVEQLGACPFRPLMYLQGVGRWEQQLVGNRQRLTVLRVSIRFAWLLNICQIICILCQMMVFWIRTLAACFDFSVERADFLFMATEFAAGGNWTNITQSSWLYRASMISNIL